MSEKFLSVEGFRPPEPMNEASSIRRYLRTLDDIYGRDGTEGNPKLSMATNVHMLFGKNEGKPVSKGWRIVMNPNMQLAEQGLIADFDDTLVGSTDRKARFYEESSQVVPEQYRDAFKTAAQTFNNAARVLPLNEAHPKRYAPLLELRAMTHLVHELNGSQPDLEAIPTSNEQARTYLRRFMENFGEDPTEATLAVDTIQVTKGGTQTEYFIEDDFRSLALRFGETPPPQVHGQVWDAFRNHMMSANIPEEELDNFDLPQDVRFIIATFGQNDLQLPKVINALRELQAKGKRLPDEILIITSGRKKPILEKFIEDTPWTKFLYVDDSVNQLREMEDTANLKRVHALREGAKRANDQVPEGVPTELIAQTSHASLVAKHLAA